MKIPVELKGRYDKLLEKIREMNSVVVAFSGGVDSTFLLAAAREALGNRVLAVTARSATYPEEECRKAMSLADRLGVRTQVIQTSEMADPAFTSNPANRCFFCKKTLFSALKELALNEGYKAVVEGSNADDLNDYRPGMQAAEELGIRSPLVEVGFTKHHIRTVSRALGLSTWDKPALACLASRIPYGEEITRDRLKRINQAEALIRSHGVSQVRVRDHGAVARIEIALDEFERLIRPKHREEITIALKALGYKYISLDLEGYRAGAMNESMPLESKGSNS